MSRLDDFRKRMMAAVAGAPRVESPVENDRLALADAEFIAYDFGEGVQVLDHARWDSNDPADFTKIAYIEFASDAPDPDAESRKCVFHVRFKPNGSIDKSYAIDTVTGNFIGQGQQQDQPRKPDTRKMQDIDDFVSHRGSWREALIIARNQARVSPPDVDDKAYWDREIRAYDGAFASYAPGSLPDDFKTHHSAWREALVIARDQAKVQAPDVDDKAYWDHELRAYDRAFASIGIQPAPREMLETAMPSIEDLRENPELVHQIPGTIMGHGLPDWPEEMTTFEERLAYQRGVAQARYVDQVAQVPARSALSDLVGVLIRADAIVAMSLHEIHGPRTGPYVAELEFEICQFYGVRHKSDITQSMIDDARAKRKRYPDLGVGDYTKVAFRELPVGGQFIDAFDVGDTWLKVSPSQAKLVVGKKFGPNFGDEGAIHEIDPSWVVEPTATRESEPGFQRGNTHLNLDTQRKLPDQQGNRMTEQTKAVETEPVNLLVTNAQGLILMSGTDGPYFGEADMTLSGAVHFDREAASHVIERLDEHGADSGPFSITSVNDFKLAILNRFAPNVEMEGKLPENALPRACSRGQSRM